MRKKPKPAEKVEVTAIRIGMLRHLAKKSEVDFQDEAGKPIVLSILGTFLGMAGRGLIRQRDAERIIKALGE